MTGQEGEPNPRDAKAHCAVQSPQPDVPDPPPNSASKTSDMSEAGDTANGQSRAQTVVEMNRPAVARQAGVPENKAANWADACSLLEKQQGEFEKRTAQLQILRQRLEHHLKKRTEQPPSVDSPAKARTAHAEHPADTYLKLKSRSRVGAADRVALDYQNSIDTLLQERHVIEQRLLELQRQVAKRDFAQDDLATPLSADAPAGRIADWRLGIATILGLIVGGLLSVTTDFSYRTSTRIVGDPSKVTAEELKAHQAAMAAAMPAELFESGSPFRLESNTPASAIGPHSFQLLAIFKDPSAGAAKLDRFARQYINEIESDRQQAAAELRRRIQRASSDEAAALVILADAKRKQADERLAIDVENPKAELERLTKAMTSARTQFTSLDTQTIATQNLAQLLEQTDIPEFPAVDQATRTTAEEQDNYLRTDLEGLRVRLGQLRNHLLDVFAQSGPVIASYARSAEELRTYLETAKLNVDDRQVISDLQEINEPAEQLNQVILGFQKRWHRHGKDLRQLTIDPRREGCLGIQRVVEDLVKNFNFDTNETLKDLQLRYQELCQGARNPAENFQLRSGLVDKIKHLVRQQQLFSDTTSRALPTSDLKLSDILHSVTGLTRRVQNRQAAIEAELSLALRKQMSQELAEQLTQQRAKLEQLQQERDEVLATFMMLHNHREQLMPYIKEHGATETVIRYDHKYVNGLLARADQLESEKRSISAELQHLESSAGPLQLRDSATEPWPVNAIERVSYVAFGTIAVTSLVYLLARLLTRSSALVRNRSRRTLPA